MQRLNKVSVWFNDENNWPWLPFPTAALMPLDQLLRFLQKQDAKQCDPEIYGDDCCPLIYLLLQGNSPKNPVVTALQFLAALMQAGDRGHLGRLLCLWWLDRNKDPKFWLLWAIRGCGMVFHQCSQLKLRVLYYYY